VCFACWAGAGNFRSGALAHVKSKLDTKWGSRFLMPSYSKLEQCVAILYEGSKSMY
jgi:hypothetical protein